MFTFEMEMVTHRCLTLHEKLQYISAPTGNEHNSENTVGGNKWNKSTAKENIEKMGNVIVFKVKQLNKL